MPEYPPCPLGLCILTEPHPHPNLGAGLWGPKPGDETREGGMTRIGDAVPLRTVMCRCPKCLKRFEGMVFFLKPGPDGWVTRPCDECSEKAWQAQQDRARGVATPPTSPFKRYGDAEPPRRPFGYED